MSDVLVQTRTSGIFYPKIRKGMRRIMKCTKKYRLSYTERAEKIVSKLSLEEKVSLMGGRSGQMESPANPQDDHYNYTPYPSGGIEREGIPAMMFCDGPRGVVCGTGKTTCFPVSMLRGATFDTELEEEIGHAIGREVKACNGNLFAGVCINLPYNPGWGRSQETYGEDSFHLGEMGSALVRGVQEENVIACIKHFAFNSMENSRFKVNVSCDIRTEREVYLRHFQKCVEAGAGAVMSSYNKYHHVFCGHNDYLLNQVLKEEWDFDGFVMSDFNWGVRDTVEAANGGQMMEMCETKYFGERLVKAVEEGKVPMERIDDAAVRIVRTLLAFTEADQKEVPKGEAGCRKHIDLALKCAREGITLIQNEGKVLPFHEEEIKTIAVIGRLVDEEVTGDHGSSRVFPAYVVTPLQGIRKRLPHAEVIYEDGSDLEKAKTAAEKADAVVFVAGYDYNDEGEYVLKDESDTELGGYGGDRLNSLGLHRDEAEMLKQVGPCNSNSAVILIGGNTILMDEWREAVGAVLMAYYPGMEGGTALAEILFGDKNPSGKLPFVLPYKESDLPEVAWDTTEQWYDYYHGYTKLDKEKKEPLAPYGFGLSYTQFSLSEPFFMAEKDSVTAECMIQNTGDREGTEVIQFYAGFGASMQERPVKALCGFRRVTLEPGESKKVSIVCPVKELAWYNPQTGDWEVEKMVYEGYIGTSSSERDLLRGSFTLN